MSRMLLNAPGFPATFMTAGGGTTAAVDVGAEQGFFDPPVDLSGAHPATALAERLLRRALGTRHGARLLDVGCGDGAMCRVARESGAGAIFAVDLARTQACLTRARCRAERVQATLCADAHALPFAAARFDVVVANLFGATLVTAAPALAAMLAPGGAFVASGALLCDAPRVVRAFASCGLDPVGPPTCAGGWAATLFRRRS